MDSPELSLPVPKKPRRDTPAQLSKQELEEICAPLRGLEFKATYERSTKSGKDVLKVDVHACEKLEGVYSWLESHKVWKGITEDDGEYRLWVDNNQELTRTGEAYTCMVTNIDIQMMENPSSQYYAFVNIATVVKAIAKANPTPLDPDQKARLEEAIKEIYKPIKEIEFRATYEGQQKISPTGYYRDLWRVDRESSSLNAALEQINSEIDAKEFEGEVMKKYFGVASPSSTQDLQASHCG